MTYIITYEKCGCVHTRKRRIPKTLHRCYQHYSERERSFTDRFMKITIFTILIAITILQYASEFNLFALEKFYTIILIIGGILLLWVVLREIIYQISTL